MIAPWLTLVIALLSIPALAVADVVTEWNEIAVATAAAGKHGASDASRSTALVHAAVFDAVNAIEARYTPYKIKVSAPAGASAEAAAVGAAHAVLVRLYPDQKRWTSAKAFTDEVSVARIYGGIHYRTSTVVGQAMGRQIGELAVQKYMTPTR